MQHEHRYDEKGVAYSNTRLYAVWTSMKSRCNTPSHTSYKNYGARGITVCEEWQHDFEAFRDWALKTGYDEAAPRGTYTIDRIDVNGPYSPENCKWSTIQEQERHKRTTIYVDDHGKKICLAEYCRRNTTNKSTWKYRNEEQEKEYQKKKSEIRRRKKGMKPREEYEAERKAKKEAHKEAIARLLEENPEITIRQMAEILPIGKTQISKLKKELRTGQIIQEEP